MASDFKNARQNFRTAKQDYWNYMQQEDPTQVNPEIAKQKYAAMQEARGIRNGERRKFWFEPHQDVPSTTGAWDRPGAREEAAGEAAARAAGERGRTNPAARLPLNSLPNLPVISTPTGQELEDQFNNSLSTLEHRLNTQDWVNSMSNTLNSLPGTQLAINMNPSTLAGGPADGFMSNRTVRNLRRTGDLSRDAARQRLQSNRAIIRDARQNRDALYNYNADTQSWYTNDQAGVDNYQNIIDKYRRG